LNKLSKIYLAGHNGLVGSSILTQLKKLGYTNILTRSHNELDLKSQQAVKNFFKTNKPEYVILAAAKVGGIFANDNFPADFIYDNLMIESNVISSSHLYKVKRLLFLGSSCIYPKFSNQPIKESELLTGELESTNEPYAIAKIAGIKLCESYNRQYRTDFRSVMPTNLYGPRDNFHPKNSHVIPALIRRFHEAKINKIDKVKVWGSGKVYREFLHVDDMAQACIHIMNIDKSIFDKKVEPMLSHINIGSGLELTISELAKLIAKVTNFSGQIIFDTNMPDGTKRKLLDSSLANDLGWRPKINLEKGLRDTYLSFLSSKDV